MNDSTWTWISGSNTPNERGVYGEKGNASIENVPGAREGAVGWYDDLREEFWLFGGVGCASNSTQGMWCKTPLYSHIAPGTELDEYRLVKRFVEISNE